MNSNDWREAYEFRRFILRTIIAYELAATPSLPPMAWLTRPPAPEDADNDRADFELEMARLTQLHRGIDLRHILLRFLKDLSKRHGRRRSERFVLWLADGYIRNLSHRQRLTIYQDRRDLIREIRRGGYRRDGEAPTLQEAQL